MVQIVNLQPAPSFGQMLGQGLSQGMQDIQQMSMQNKMQALQEQKQLQQRQAQFMDMENNIPGLGRAVMALGPQGAAKMITEMGPTAFSRMFAPETVQRMASKELPVEERPAVEQYEAETETHLPEPKERVLSSLDDYRKKIAPNYDELGMSAKERVDRQAEREFNSAMKMREEIARQEERQEKKQAPFVKEIRTKADAAKTILSAANNMEKIRERGNLGITSKARSLFSPKARSDKAAYDTQASQFLSYYKALFPRGFTQQEFKHIESNWLPSSNNTDERNQAIEKSFKEMAHVLLQKSEILDSLRDENGRLPSNAEQKVDMLMGKKIEELQNKFINEVPEGEKMEENSMSSMPKASDHNGRTIIDTKTGSRFKSNGKNWVRISQ